MDGVALTSADDAPSPTPFTARTWNVYAVPLVRLDSVNVVVSLSLPAMGVQALQLPVDFWRYSQRTMLSSPGSVHVSVTLSLPVAADRFDGAAGTVNA